MIPFRLDETGCATATFTPGETAILAQLANESAQLVAQARHDLQAGADPRIDPAVIRLLPDAYPNDQEASGEFRRYTSDGLAERKVMNARTVAESLVRADAGAQQPSTVRLDDAAALAWLRALTDIRLILGARLGIVQDGDDGDTEVDDFAALRSLFDWLGGVQESLVGALEEREARGR